MTIAILKSPQADKQRKYNQVEFVAASHGVRVAAYVSGDGKGTFRGLPLVSPSDLQALGVEMVVAVTPLLPGHVEPFINGGWPVMRMLSLATQGAEIRARWNVANGGLAARRPTLTGNELTPRVQYTPVDGVAVGDQPPALAPEQLRAITETVFAAYRRAVADAPTSGSYAVGRNWGSFLKMSRPTFYNAAKSGDVETIDRLLANCLRNELTSGTFGGDAGYNDYVQAGRNVLKGLRDQHHIWQYCVKTPDMARVVSPAVGNPFGVKVGAGVVHPNTFLNDSRAQYIGGLLGKVERPIMLDLGGGFGGLGHQLLANHPGIVYMDFDLPENLLVASYFLMAAHPDKRVLLYESREQVLDAETLREYDFVMMPNFMLPRVADRAVNLFTNFISLSEMDYASIVEYLRQADRVSDGYVYQENLLDNGENYEFYPVSVFPDLPHFTMVWSAPSRWPVFSPASPSHCHGEFLYARHDLDVARYLAGQAEPRYAPGERLDQARPVAAYAVA